MLTLLEIVAPIFIVVAGGWIAARSGLFPVAMSEGLLTFVNRFATPVLLFRAAYRLDPGAVFDPGMILAYYGGSVTCFVLSLTLARRLFARRPGEAVSVGFSATFANTIFLGYPVILRAYGDEALGPLFMLIALHAPVLYIMGMVTMETTRRDGRGAGAALWAAARSIASNALLIGLAIGFAMNALSLPLPGALDEATALVERAVLPCALFGLGAALTRFRVREGLAETGMVVAVKLMVHPLVALGLALLLGVPADVARVAVVLAAMPGGLNIYIFATLYDRAVGTAASAMLIGTAISVATIPLWLWITGAVFG